MKNHLGGLLNEDSQDPGVILCLGPALQPLSACVVLIAMLHQPQQQPLMSPSVSVCTTEILESGPGGQVLNQEKSHHPCFSYLGHTG